MANNHLTPEDIRRYQQRAPRAGYWLGVLPTHPFIHGPAVDGQQIPPQDVHQQNPPPYPFGPPPPYHFQGPPPPPYHLQGPPPPPYLPPYLAPNYPPPPMGQPLGPVGHYPTHFSEIPNIATRPSQQRKSSIVSMIQHTHHITFR